MLAAVSVIIALVGAYIVPHVLFLSPAPLAILIYRHGLKSGIAVSVVAALLAGMLSHAIGMVIMFLVLGLVGIAIGEALREKFTATRTMLVGTIAALVGLVVPFLLVYFLLGSNLLELMFKMWDKVLESTSVMMERTGMPQDEVKRQTQLVREQVRLLFPASLLFSAVVFSFLNYWVVRSVLRRLGDDVDWFPAFDRWRFPWYLAWGYILGQGAFLGSTAYKSELLKAVGLNLRFFFDYTFGIQGIALAWFFVQKYRLGRGLKLLVMGVVTGSILFGAVPLREIVIWAGVLDTWFNFRKL